MVGVSGEYKFYVYTTSYTDYTEYVSRIKVEQSLSSLWTIEVELDSIPDVSYLYSGNYMVFTFGSNIAIKFVMEQPEIDSDGNVRIIGYSSTGNISANNNERLKNTVTPDISYQNMTISDILTKTTSPFGICVNESGNKIVEVSISDIGNNKASYKFPNVNRLLAIQDICKSQLAEFWFTYTNLGSSAGTDYLYIAKRKGSDKSYGIYTYGINQNAYVSSRNIEWESLANKVIVYGATLDKDSKQIKTENFHATLIRSYLTTNLDTYLNADITASSPTIYVDDPIGPTSNFVIKIDNEQILISSRTGTTLTVSQRGYNGTTATPHKKGTDVLLYNNITLSLYDASQFPTSGSVYVGSEKMNYSSKSGNNLTVSARKVNNIEYSHLANVEVYSAAYSTTSPQTNSSIQKYGLHSKSFDYSSGYTKHSLDLLARYLLEKYSEPIKRIEVRLDYPYEVLETNNITLGDSILLYDDASNTNGLSFRIIKIMYDISQESEDVYLYLTNEKYSFLEELYNSFSIDVLAPTKYLSDKISEYSSWDGSNYILNASNIDINSTEFFNVVAGEFIISSSDGKFSIDYDKTDVSIYSSSSGGIEISSTYNLELESTSGYIYLTAPNIQIGTAPYIKISSTSIRLGDSPYIQIYKDGNINVYFASSTDFKYYDSTGNECFRINDDGGITFPARSANLSMYPTTANYGSIGTISKYYNAMYAHSFITVSPTTLNINPTEAIKKINIDNKLTYPKEVLTLPEKDETGKYTSPGIRLEQLCALLIQCNQELINRLEGLESIVKNLENNKGGDKIVKPRKNK